MQREQLDEIIVTAAQMAAIEGQIFAAGMPVAALMEKAASLCATKIVQLYPLDSISQVGILVGPGHNGGDALVIARELYLSGYTVSIYRALPKLKELTSQHLQYAQSLGIPVSEDITALEDSDLIIDGLFGFGLTRNLSGDIATAVNTLNDWSIPIVSIDIPSGLHTDTGEVLGTAIKATHTLCLGLWKLGFFQEAGLEYIGKAERIDFGIPPQDAEAIISQSPRIQQVNSATAREYLPLSRSLTTHKYKQGHLLLICGSLTYAGGAILTGLGARASGVGMLSIAVPKSLKPLLVSHLPEALIIGCEETDTGAIAQLPDLSKYDIIACGPGLTMDGEGIMATVLKAECPLVLDADGLNIIAQIKYNLLNRPSATVITPHLGEFKRLFPHIQTNNRIAATQQAAKESGAIVLLKGAKTAIASPQGAVWLIGESTPALARGGSGDVLTGLIGGLMAQSGDIQTMVALGAWCHAQGGILAESERTQMGVDAYTLAQYIIPAIAKGKGERGKGKGEREKGKG